MGARMVPIRFTPWVSMLRKSSIPAGSGRRTMVGGGKVALAWAALTGTVIVNSEGATPDAVAAGAVAMDVTPTTAMNCALAEAGGIVTTMRSKLAVLEAVADALGDTGVTTTVGVGALAVTDGARIWMTPSIASEGSGRLAVALAGAVVIATRTTGAGRLAVADMGGV